MTRRLTLFVMVAALSLTGCDTSPTEIVGSPLRFEGSLGPEGTDLHLMTVNNAGGVRVIVESLEAVPALEGDSLVSIGFGLGEPGGTDDCFITFTAGLTITSQLSFGLSEGEYCVRLFDNGTIGEDAVRNYSLLVTPSD